MFSIDIISKINRLPKKKINKKYIPILLILSFIPSSLILTRATISLYCPRRNETGVKRKAGLGTVVNTRNPSTREMVAREAKIQAK